MRIIKYDLKKETNTVLFKPENKYIYFTDEEKFTLDTLFEKGYFDVKRDNLLKIRGYNYNIENKSFKIFIDKLSKWDINYEKQEYLLYFNRGIFSLKDSSISFKEFSHHNYTRFNKFTTSLNMQLINIKYGSDYIIEDTLALVLNVDKNGDFDTLLTVDNLALKKHEFKYKPNELVDLLEIINEKEFLILSNKLKKIYFCSNNSVNSVYLKGILTIYKGFDIKDMIILDDKVYIVGLSDTKRLLIQSYSFDGKLLSEKISYLNEDILLATQFVKNDKNEIILMNKWRYKRWTLDYLDK